MKKLNEISMSQCNGYNIAPGKSGKSNNIVIAMMAEIAQLGFKFDKKLIHILKTLDKKELKFIKDDIVRIVSEKIGSNVTYKPLFIGFPLDVPDENEYFLKRIIGFIDNYVGLDADDINAEKLSCGCFVDSDLFDISLFGACPICQRQGKHVVQKIDRKKLNDKVILKKINYLSEEDQLEIIRQLMGSKVSLSMGMKGDLVKSVNILDEQIIDLVPLKIENKENLAFIFSTLLKRESTKNVDPSSYFKTATDVLRLAVALSGGDISLKELTKFKMNNFERRVILSLLNSIESSLEDLMRYRQRWLRLSEYLHIGSYKEKYNVAFKNIDILRNNEKSIDTFNKKVHGRMLNLKNDKNPEELIEILKARPGEFARRLDYILRVSENDSVINEFQSAIGLVSVTILLKLRSYYSNRWEKRNFRYFMPKGNVSKIKVLYGDNRKFVSKVQSKKIIKIVDNELKSRFSKKNKLKRVYLDPSLKDILIPLVLRNSSKSLKSIARGSRIKLRDDAKFLRLFIYWKENHKVNRVDVDLTAGAYSSDFKYKFNLSWTSLSASDCKHSGDIQSAPNGASEFIDLNVDSLLKENIRYVVVNVYSYTGQNFSDFECFSGIMERKSQKTGEIYEPKTVKDKFDLNSDGTAVIPYVFDLKTRELIWCDISFSNATRGSIEGNTEVVSKIGNALSYMKLDNPNLYDLFYLQSKARGAIIDTERDPSVKYDECFDIDFATDVSNIMTNWLD